MVDQRQGPTNRELNMTDRNLQFVIARSVCDPFPSIRVGAFLASDLERAVDRLDGPASLARARAALQAASLSTANLLDDPRIREWRGAVARCKLKPSAVRSSAEQLVRRIVGPNQFATGLPLVDTYCAVSAKHVAPIGGYDAEKLPSDVIVLRLARPATDAFTALGGRAEDMPLGESVAVYASADEVLCYAFNHRDSQKTSLDAATGRAVFFSEAVHECQWEHAETALCELRELLGAAGAQVSPVVWATPSAPSIAIG
ncbi:MAG: phenylalanine--tRNA ligase beta subunit-related protein [Byssovorax sp.]